MRLILVALALGLTACSGLPNLPDIQNADYVQVSYTRSGDDYVLTYQASGRRSPASLGQIMGLIR